MNLRQPNANEATQTFNRSKSVSPMSGICTRCIDGCRGNCEVFKATFRGRELLYPGPFGEITAGGDKNYPIDYSHLNIHGYAMGTKGLGVVQGSPDTAIFPIVNTETAYGWEKKIKKSPELDRRIETYKRYHQGYGEILVQMNVEDTRLGVAEYVIGKHGLNTIELKWGQGAKCIGGGKKSEKR